MNGKEDEVNDNEYHHPRNLKPATISAVDNSVTINCMFNPEHYTVKKQNAFHFFTEAVIPPKPEFKNYGRSSPHPEYALF
ncbi:MAG: hypothetical protein M5U34_05015 [Chloroflexi bacterium]|nr:hypothetical protein [Chloroflexota bacterium]